MGYKHGINTLENPTSLVVPVQADSAMPVYVGIAPIHLAENQDYVNKPLLAFSYGEAVKALGFHDDFSKYTLSEAMDSQFGLFAVAPAVFINVLDPARHKATTTDATVNITSNQAKITADGVLLSTLVVKLSSAAQPLVKNTDYTAAFNSDGEVIITRISTGTIPANQTTLTVTYDRLDVSLVTDNDIIGGYDAVTGKYTGLELVNQIFPLFRKVPCQIVVPKFSKKSAIAAIMKAKANNINGVFKAIALVDIDTSSTGADIYTEAPAWKNNNNYTDPQQIAFYGKPRLGDKVYHGSTQVAGLIGLTDTVNDGIPYVSPSNKNLQMDSLVNEAGDEIFLELTQANYLNGEGIMTALNWIGGWRAWGNRTAAYPAITDPKDNFIPLRRMFNWFNNKLILTYHDTVDDPTNVRLINSVVDSLNIEMNGYTAIGAILGGRCEFREEENPLTNLADGKIKFHLFLASPPPGEDITFVLEYDVNYLNTLFS